MIDETRNLVNLTQPMDHKNVIKYHEWYETTNHLWIIQELVDGGTLRSMLKLDRVFSGCMLRSTVKQVLSGLRYLHIKNIISNAINPDDIEIDNCGIIRLCNFNYSHSKNDDIFRLYPNLKKKAQRIENKECTAFILGNFHYLAPEVLKGSIPNVASDLWSFGFLLYELQHGFPPYNISLSHDGRTVLRCISQNTLKFDHSSTNRRDYLNIIQGLLIVDKNQRFDWKQLRQRTIQLGDGK
ncbi:hypothetical protein SNEBB_003290 [Seison nebaliae]|nr:hypothetical protein SNEBB_003290 [Seison nebaliae]